MQVLTGSIGVYAGVVQHVAATARRNKSKGELPIAGGVQLSATFRVLAVVFIAASLLFAQEKPVEITDVTRATLDNGLRVVIVRDPARAGCHRRAELSGRAATKLPTAFPGMAHAQEHMAFRGCSELSADQISAIFAQLGGFGNADTQQNITQYLLHRSRRGSRHRVAG